MSENRPPDQPVRARVQELHAELSQARASLDAAEKALDRIPALSSMADKARTAKDESLSKAYENDAQTIRDQRRNALLRLDLVRQNLIRTLRPLAVHDPVMREVLKQMERVSPYPSVTAADELLALLNVFARAPEPRGACTGQDSGSPVFTERQPSQEDRQRLAALLPQAIAERGHSFQSAAHEMKISENTLKSLRTGRAVQPETWRRAVRFLQSPKR